MYPFAAPNSASKNGINYSTAHMNTDLIDTLIPTNDEFLYHRKPKPHSIAGSLLRSTPARCH